MTIMHVRTRLRGWSGRTDGRGSSAAGVAGSHADQQPPPGPRQRPRGLSLKARGCRIMAVVHNYFTIAQCLRTFRTS